MHKTIVATVGLLLLSVTAVPVSAGGTGTGESGEAAGSLHVVAAGGAAVAATAGSATAAHTQRARLLAPPGVDSIDVTVLAVAGGLVGLLLAVGVLLRRRRRSSAADRPSADVSVESVEGDWSPATSPPSRSRDVERGPSAVRTDEEYVIQLLIANHGRMRQARIVEETDWSKAKVSRLLSRMEEREQVVRERAGREKIVQLADANTSIPL